MAINMTPAHPGDFVHTEVIEELGLSVTKAAEILGVRRATLSDLLNGYAALSPEMALRIEKAFDVRMDLLLRMQAWYDAAQMRARAVKSMSGATSRPDRQLPRARLPVDEDKDRADRRFGRRPHTRVVH